MMYALPLLLFTFGTASGCTCTGVNTGVDTARYGSSYGTTCSAWEDGGTFTSAPSCNTYTGTGTWCCRPWCYVDPSTCSETDYYASFFQAPNAEQSTLYFSYDVCDSSNTAEPTAGSPAARTYATNAACPWQGPDEYASCACTGDNTGIEASRYGSDYGTSCKAWEDGGEFTQAPSCATFSQTGTWCCRAWCYVDPTRCDGTRTPFFASYFQSATSSAQQSLYFSYEACDSGNTAANAAVRTYATNAACPWQGPNVYMPDVRVQAAIYDHDEGSFNRFGCGVCGQPANARGCLQPRLNANGKPAVARTDGSCDQLRDVTAWYTGTPSATVNLDFCPNYQTGLHSFDWPEDFLPMGDGNALFAMEIEIFFNYNGGEVFNFRGDDDVFVFINGTLVLDIGGCHGAQDASVALDSLGLERYRNYEMKLFHAERCYGSSNFKAEFTLRQDQGICPNACNSVREQGFCNIETGTCECYNGFAGIDCSTSLAGGECPTTPSVANLRSCAASKQRDATPCPPESPPSSPEGGGGGSAAIFGIIAAGIGGIVLVGIIVKKVKEANSGGKPQEPASGPQVEMNPVNINVNVAVPMAQAVPMPIAQAQPIS